MSLGRVGRHLPRRVGAVGQAVTRFKVCMCGHVYMCMCVCMYVCMYDCVYVCACMYVCMCRRMCSV